MFNIYLNKQICIRVCACCTKSDQDGCINLNFYYLTIGCVFIIIFSQFVGINYLCCLTLAIVGKEMFIFTVMK